MNLPDDGNASSGRGHQAALPGKTAACVPSGSVPDDEAIPRNGKPRTPSGMRGWKTPLSKITARRVRRTTRHWVMMFSSATVALCSPLLTGDLASSLK